MRAAAAVAAACCASCSVHETVAFNLSEIAPPSAASLILAIDDGGELSVHAVDLRSPAPLPALRGDDDRSVVVQALFYTEALDDLQLSKGLLSHYPLADGRALPPSPAAFVASFENGSLRGWEPITRLGEDLAAFRLPPKTRSCPRFRVIERRVLNAAGEVTLGQRLGGGVVIATSSGAAAFVTRDAISPVSISDGSVLAGGDGFTTREIRVADVAGRVGAAEISADRSTLEIRWRYQAPEPFPLVAIDALAHVEAFTAISATGAVWVYQGATWRNIHQFTGPPLDPMSPGHVARTDETSLVIRAPSPTVIRWEVGNLTFDPVEGDTPLTSLGKVGGVGFVAGGADGRIYVAGSDHGWVATATTGVPGAVRHLRPLGAGAMIFDRDGWVAEWIVARRLICPPVRITETEKILESTALDDEERIYVVTGERTAAGIPILLLERNATNR